MNGKTQKPIPKIIKMERKRLGYTQTEFALRVGVSLSFLRKVEQGKEAVKLDKVNQILNFLGYTLTPQKVSLDE